MNLRSAAGGLSRFAHLVGAGRARASDTNPGTGEPEPGNPAPGTPADPGPGEGGGDTDPGTGGDSNEGGDGGQGDGGQAEGGAGAAPPATDPARTTDAREYARGFLAAQQRAALILSHAAAAGNLPLACELACGNQLPTAQAISLLNAAGTGTPPPAAPARPGLDARMRGQGAAPVGAEPGGGPAKTEAQQAAAFVSASLALVNGQSK